MIITCIWHSDLTGIPAYLATLIWHLGPALHFLGLFCLEPRPPGQSALLLPSAALPSVPGPVQAAAQSKPVCGWGRSQTQVAFLCLQHHWLYVCVHARECVCARVCAGEHVRVRVCVVVPNYL